MQKEHKLQRNLDSTFEAELKPCSLSGLTTWWQQMVCVGSGHGRRALIVRCTSAWELHLWGQKRGGRQRLWAPAGGAVLMGGMRVGSLCPLALGLSILPPSQLAPPQESSQAPGSPLLLSEPCVHSTCVRASFGFVFFLRLLCPRLRIRETTEKLTLMQTHEGLFTNSSLCPCIPDTVEQGLGTQGGF